MKEKSEKSRCLIIFVKYPENGKVKSRLAGYLTNDTAANLYENFVRDILATAEKGPFEMRIYFDPEEKAKEIRALLGEKYAYAVQRGQNLGEKMKNAFLQEFNAGCENVVLIGSDCPDLPVHILEKSFLCLENQGLPVIGPALDGGYYLIGFHKNNFCSDVFSGIQWSTSSVLERTMDILRTRNYKTEMLPIWRDVDTCDDLDFLIEKNRTTPFVRSNTIKFLKSNNLFPK
ncbi:MAG: TIGR04282 family arsenosugar biosynthesis glycosyltransferase [Smithella sp.]